tara:strand:+ start:20103 stop:20756 length:654 start_codon:yes stop_codon:yes gene_type:complete
MLSENPKFIFIHIPKTAGTSIESYLRLLQKGDCKKHMTIKDYENSLGDSMSEYFKFTVIRNPWDRMVSYWKYRQGKHWAPIDGTINNFNVWLKFITALDLNNLDGSTSTSNISDFRMGIDSQYNSLISSIGKMDVQLINFDNLQADFNQICDQIGISRYELPHINKTNRKHYSTYYDEETKDIISQKYSDDIKHFGFTFQNVENIDCNNFPARGNFD